MTPAEDDQIRRLSWLALRSAGADIERDDLVQIGRLALLVAEAEGRVPADPAHRRNYITQRVLGEMRDHMARQWARGQREVPGDDAGGALVDGGDASSYSHIARALAGVAAALRPGGRVFIEALLSGVPATAAMTLAGVPVWGHAQYRRRFEKLIERWL